MIKAVYQKGGYIVFQTPRLPLLFSLSLPGVPEGTLSYGSRRSRVTRAKALLDFTGLPDGDYPILLTVMGQGHTVGAVRKEGDALFDLTVRPDLIAGLCERLAKAEEDILTLKVQTRRLADKIGNEEIFTL